jgi:hypothetical protein
MVPHRDTMGTKVIISMKMQHVEPFCKMLCQIVWTMSELPCDSDLFRFICSTVSRPGETRIAKVHMHCMKGYNISSTPCSKTKWHRLMKLRFDMIVGFLIYM